jgi:hypothetical protein
MQTIRYWFLSAALMFCAIRSPLANGQDTPKAHWGVQGDFSYVNVPRVAVEHINALPEHPDITGSSFQVGLVHFHANGAPSYALQFTRLKANLVGSINDGPFVQTITGTGNLSGFMATKYVNVVARRHISSGFAFGGGIGRGEANYTRQMFFREAQTSTESNAYNRVIPLIEILGRIDFRPIKYLTIGPYYGIRNGTLAAGLTVRLHITK